MLGMKLAFPRHVHINRGNHTRTLPCPELMISRLSSSSKYGVDTSLLDDADDAFAAMPLGCVVNHGLTRTMVLHGHLPRSLPSLDELKRSSSRCGRSSRRARRMLRL